MLNKDILLKNPMRLLGNGTEGILTHGGFGAVLARAGVGKTSLAVQLALNSLLQDKNVLHISLNDPVNKVSLWYEEVFRKIAMKYDTGEMMQLWESVLAHRFIMTFQVEGFSVPKLRERLTDLTTQGIFSPQMVLIDGLPFDEAMQAQLSDLKGLAQELGLTVWFTVRTHRHEDTDPDDIPPQLINVVNLFDVVLLLQPEGKEIHVRMLKGGIPDALDWKLMLDPATMLIKDIA